MESGLVASHRLRLPTAAARNAHLLRHRPLALRLPRHLPGPTPLRLPAALPLRPCLPPLRAAAAASPAPGDAAASPPPKFLGIEAKTLKKIVPLGLMFFCILFNYTILRDTKDVLVVTAKGSSAEIIPFLKTWVNLPMAVGFMLLYTKLADVLSKEALFYAVIFPFIAFFGAFAYVLYPMRDAIHPTALADRLLAALGPSFLGPVAILRVWSFCLFYVMAELWGSVVISVLFWGFANQVHRILFRPLCSGIVNSGSRIARIVNSFLKLRRSIFKITSN
jgi:ATP:ADP antiporter, AAA family